MVGDVGLAEDLAQEAVADALAQWPESGVPRNAGAWLTAVAKRKAIDGWRRRERLDERCHAIAHELDEHIVEEWQPIDDGASAAHLIVISVHNRPHLAENAPKRRSSTHYPVAHGHRLII